MNRLKKNKSINYYKKLNDILMNSYLPPNKINKRNTSFEKLNFIKKDYKDLYLKLKNKNIWTENFSLKEIIFKISKEIIIKLLFIIKQISKKNYDIVLLENFNIKEVKKNIYFRHIIYLIGLIRETHIDINSEWMNIFKNNYLKKEINKLIYKLKVSKLDINNLNNEDSYNYLLIFINKLIFIINNKQIDKIIFSKIDINNLEKKKKSIMNITSNFKISNNKKINNNSYNKFINSMVNKYNVSDLNNNNAINKNLSKKLSKTKFLGNNFIINKNSNNNYLFPKLNNVMEKNTHNIEININKNQNKNNEFQNINKKNKIDLIKIKKLFRIAKRGKKFLINTQIESLSKDIINLKDNTNNTPLYYSCLRGNYEISKNLIKLGANIYERCQNDNTPLHAIFKSNNYKLILEIMKLKPDLTNYFNSEGMSPLAYANKKIINEFNLENKICYKKN